MRLSALFLAALLLFAAPAMASIIKKPPAKIAELTYKDIPCTEEHKACIYEIIATVAETNKLSLYFKQAHLKGLGNQISDVHPLKFLATIFSDSYLKSCMNLIWGDYFKRTEFLGGLSPNMTLEMQKGKLLMHIPDFAKDVGVEAEHLRPYFDAQDWENLVLFLIQS